MQNKPILVVGAGIAGITAAVEIAEVGHEVILIEKETYLGGNVVKMNNYFPKLCPPACGLEINFRRIRQNRRIKVFTSTIAKEISGQKGRYKVSLIQEAKYIKGTCTSCGKCSEVCPEERPDAFNYGFTKTKAVYLPHDMSFPMTYSIDGAYCKKEACAKCVDACQYDAIDLSAVEKQFEMEVANVIVSTGWKSYDASKLELLNYSEFDNVVSNVEFERLIAPGGVGDGKLGRPSDGQVPKSVAFVQCAGSRDESHLPYCSAVCCSASLKHALNIIQQYPDSQIKIFYIDLRVTGRNEDFLTKVQENKNIELIKGKVAGISEVSESNNLVVEAEDIMAGRKRKEEVDLVVLATGISSSILEFTVERNPAGFLSDRQESGIITAGCCKKPMDVSSSVKDATAAALKAIQHNIPT